MKRAGTEAEDVDNIEHPRQTGKRRKPKGQYTIQNVYFKTSV